MRLAGKVALITGAGRNMGRVVAEAFAAEGATLAIASLSDRDALEAVAQTCRERGADVLTLTGDVARREACEAMVHQTLDRFGRVDVLVSSVAIRPRLPFAETTHEVWQRVLDVNFGGSFNLCKAVVPGMVAQGSGSIITFGGLHAMTDAIGGANSAAKMGLLGLVRSLGTELAPSGVRINMVVPGEMDTEGHVGASRSAIPMGRRGRPDEVVGACLFLASDESSYITGDRILVTGGRFI